MFSTDGANNAMCNRIKRYTWRDWTITAAEMQHMTDEELTAWARRAREAFRLAQQQDQWDGEAPSVT
jgi:hypothetical protein